MGKCLCGRRRRLLLQRSGWRSWRRFGGGWWRFWSWLSGDFCLGSCRWGDIKGSEKSSEKSFRKGSEKAPPLQETQGWSTQRQRQEKHINLKGRRRPRGRELNENREPG